MKKLNDKELEKRLEMDNVRTIKTFYGRINTLYFDVIQNEIAINMDEINLGVFPLNEIIKADQYFEQQCQILNQTK